MPADKSDEIIRLLNEGKTSVEIVGMGYSKSTVYDTRRKLGQSKKKASPTIGKQASHAKAAPIPSADSPAPETESDPEIIQLKRELTKAELRKQLVTLNSSSDLEALSRAANEIGLLRRQSCEQWENERNLCGFWAWPSAKDIPQGIGEIVPDDKDTWRLRPSALYCAMCTADLQQQIRRLEDQVKRIPFLDLREDFRCSCGNRGMLAISMKCTHCGKEAWWGWWPDKS